MNEGEVTLLLRRSREGDRAALDELLPFVYAELRKIAASFLRSQRPNHTLQPTALLHEAYLRLSGAGARDYRDRTHFFATAAAIMRNILVDHARARQADKRGGGMTPVSIELAAESTAGKAADLLALDDALHALAGRDERKARILELRYFGGLTAEETAETLGMSVATVGREARFAVAWLRREMGAGALGAER